MTILTEDPILLLLLLVNHNETAGEGREMGGGCGSMRANGADGQHGALGGSYSVGGEL